jgi:hypothetical protein
VSDAARRSNNPLYGPPSHSNKWVGRRIAVTDVPDSPTFFEDYRH